MNCIRCGVEMNNTTGGNYTCPKCGMEVNDLVYRPQNCNMPLPHGFGEQKGWICPVCGRVRVRVKSIEILLGQQELVQALILT